MKWSGYCMWAVAALATCALSAAVWGQNSPENRVVCSDDPAIYAIQQCGGYAGKFEITNGSNNKVALMGATSGTGGGIFGYAPSGIYGVLGQSDKAGGFGVWGRANGSGGVGVYGSSTGGYAGKFEITSGSNNKVALMGATSGTGGGVYGKAISGVYGVLGESNNIGVYGKSALGYAGKFEITSASNKRVALMGVTSGTGGGVYGKAMSGEYGVLGESNNIAVYGKSILGRAGVFDIYGGSNTHAALSAQTYGSGPAIYGASEAGNAAWFENANPSNDNSVVDVSTNGSGDGLYVNQTGGGNGVMVRMDNASSLASALYAHVANGDSDGYAISAHNQGTGVTARFWTSNTGNASATILTSSQAGPAITAQSYGTGRAGEFRAYGVAEGSALYTWKNGAGLAFHAAGSAYIQGTLSKLAGSFKIDHPLDPENKYLYHSFVESPDMMNIYNGNVILDSNGEAWVELPEWFDALNKDFRYQLTAIGAPGPNLYVAEEIAGNEFKIAGGQPGMKVSWQVTGIRQDAYANAHRIPVEEEKPARERGTYLSPESFGEPVSRGSDWMEHGPEARTMLLGR